MPKKLILFDIDGTLLYHGPQGSYVPQDTLLALERLRAAGHEVCIASGRARVLSQRLMNELGINNAVLHNGAMLVHEGQVVYANPIAPDICDRVLTYLQRMPQQTVAYNEQGVYAHQASSGFMQFIRAQTDGKLEVQPLDKREHAMLSICTDHLDVADTPLLADCAVVNWSGSMLDINAQGTNKGAALQRFAHLLGYAIHDTIAVGDAANDIQMLRAAGLGIAMGNAAPTVKAAADMVTDAVHQGGIYNAFERLALLHTP